MNEQAVRFGAGDGLVGIVTHPAEPPRRGPAPGLLLLNSGILHRPGPNRIYVTLARTLAEAGFAVLRFDFSGIGDSEVRTDTLAFGPRTVEETQRAMDCLRTLTGADRFLLAGICSGGQVAVSAAARDARVAGVIAINHTAHRGAGGRDFGRTMVRHYKRLAFSSSFSGKAWSKAISGRINSRRLGETLQSLARTVTSVTRPAEPRLANRFVTDVQTLVERRVPTLLIHSEGDEGLDYTNMVLVAQLHDPRAAGVLGIEVIQGANHTFTLVPHQHALVAAVSRWTTAFSAS